jgi:hypothetical protein
MPLSNEDFIKKAFESGLNEQQVRAAVAERNQRVKPAVQDQGLSGILNMAGNIVAPAAASLGRTLGAGLGQFSPEAQAAEQSAQGAEVMRQQLIQRAAVERDPQKKSLLLRTILSSGQNLSAAEQQLTGGYQEAAGLTEQQMQRSPQEFAGRQAASTGAELASFLLPGALSVGKGATVASRIAEAGVRGGVSGALAGAGSTAREAENFGEGAARITIGTVTGAVAGAALQGAGEVIKRIIPKNARPEAIDVSDKIAETRRVIRSGEETAADRLRASQFLKYKNKANDLINEKEVARILDDIDLQYSSTDQLGQKTKNLAASLEDVKISSLKSQGDKIDVSPISDIFYKDASRSLRPKAELDKLMKGIIRESSDIQKLKGADPVSANKLASELGKEARLYYSQWQRSGDPAAQHMYVGLNNAKNFIRDQIDTKFANSISYTPDQLANISKLSPKLAAAVQDKTLSMADINYIQAMLNNANSLAKDTSLALTGAGQQVLGGKGMVNIPILSQVSGVIGQGADVALSPAQAFVRTQTAKGLASGASGLSGLVGGTGNVSQAAVSAATKNPAFVANPTISAIQRLIEKEKSQKQKSEKLPQSRTSF